MSRVVKHLSLWSGAALLAILDAVLCIQIVTFIGYSDIARSGSTRMWVATKIGWIAVASVPVALWALRSSFVACREMNPRMRFVARLPLICLVALLLNYFVVLKIIRCLYAY